MRHVNHQHDALRRGLGIKGHPELEREVSKIIGAAPILEVISLYLAYTLEGGVTVRIYEDGRGREIIRGVLSELCELSLALAPQPTHGRFSLTAATARAVLSRKSVLY